MFLKALQGLWHDLDGDVIEEGRQTDIADFFGGKLQIPEALRVILEV